MNIHINWKSNILALTLLFVGCSLSEQPSEDRVVKVNVVSVGGGQQSLCRSEYVGTIEEASASNLSFGAGGRVTAVYVKEGQHVRKGQLLAALDNSTALNSYNAAKATLDQAQDGYNRAKQVHDKGSLPEVKWVEVQTQLNQAQSIYELARKNLNDCKLYAPAAGIIGNRAIEVGSSATPFQPVMRLLNLDGLYVKTSIPEGHISQVQVGDSVRVMVNAVSEDTPLTGVIEERNVSADALSHSYLVRIRLLQEKQQELLPGMVCRVQIDTPSDTIGFEIPSRAVQLANDGSRFVWVVQDSVAVMRPVHIGDLTRSGVIVTQGLEPGDKVIIDGTLKVATNTKVTFNLN